MINFCIGSQEWELDFLTTQEMTDIIGNGKEVDLDGAVFLGLTSSVDSKIWLNKEYPLKMATTLNHELMHACIATYQLSKSFDTNKKCYSEEDICNFTEVLGDEYARLLRELKEHVKEYKNAIQEDKKR